MNELATIIVITFFIIFAAAFILIPIITAGAMFLNILILLTSGPDREVRRKIIADLPECVIMFVSQLFFFILNLKTEIGWIQIGTENRYIWLIFMFGVPLGLIFCALYNFLKKEHKHGLALILAAAVLCIGAAIISVVTAFTVYTLQ